jgi:NAD(P)H-dependent FMN reductase
MVGVSNGVFGGARALISLTPVLRRLGMVMVHKDMFIGDSDNFFEAGGNVKDESFDKRLDVFVNDLVWLAQVLKQGKK